MWLIPILALFGIGGATAYGYDQHQKLRKVQEECQRQLAIKDAQIRILEAQIRELETNGRRNEEWVRVLSAEVERLRREKVEYLWHTRADSGWPPFTRP